MAKVINEYTAIPGYAFTADNIKNRSSNVGDEVVSGTTVQISNITTTDIRNATGGTTNAVGALTTSSNVNRWSKFAPKTIQKAGSPLFTLIVGSSSAPYLMGDFAGYNHSASKPRFEANASEGDYISRNTCCTTPTFSFSYKIHLGDFEYLPYLTEGGNTADNMVVEIWNGTTKIIDEWIPIAGEFTKTNEEDLVSYSHALTVGYADFGALTVKLWFGYRVDVDNMDLICALPDADLNFTVGALISTPTINSFVIYTPWKEGSSCVEKANAFLSYLPYSIDCYGNYSIPSVYVDLQDGSGLYSSNLCSLDYSIDGGSTWNLASGILLDANNAIDITGQITDTIDCTTDIRFRMYKASCY